MSHATVSRYENGQLRPSLEVLLLLRQMAGTEPGRIVHRAIEFRLGSAVDSNTLDPLSATARNAASSEGQPGFESMLLEAAEKMLPRLKLSKFERQLLIEVWGIILKADYVDPSLVKLMRAYREYGHSSRVRRLFQTATSYLEVEVARLAPKGLPGA